MDDAPARRPKTPTPEHVQPTGQQSGRPESARGSPSDGAGRERRELALDMAAKPHHRSLEGALPEDGDESSARGTLSRELYGYAHCVGGPLVRTLLVAKRRRVDAPNA